MATAAHERDEHERFSRGLAVALILAAPSWAAVAYCLVLPLR